MTARPARPWLARVAALLLGLVLAVAAGELVVRLAGLDVRWLRETVGEMGVDPAVTRVSADPELLYELVPGATFTGSFEPGSQSPEEARYSDDPRTVTINAFGFRDPPRREAKPPGVQRILCLGGSNTYGASVSDGNTWPRQLEVVLSARLGKPVEVWNLGVDGYKTRQKVRQAEQTVARFDADLVLIQLWNTGPRLALPPPAMLPLREVRAWSGVWWENLLGSPRADGALFILFQRSALYRLGVVGLNRAVASRHPEAWRVSLDDRAEAEAGRLLRRFLGGPSGGVPVVLLVPPVGSREHGLGGLDLPMIDLQAQWNAGRLVGAAPDVGLLHPGAAGYAVYADRIASALIAAGCLDEGESPPCRLPSSRKRSDPTAR